MPSILFGSGSSERRVGNGEFFCPQCRAMRRYERTVVRRSLSVLSIPIPAFGRRGEYVACQTCLGTFRPEALAYNGEETSRPVLAEYQRAMKRILALMVVVDGRIREPEIPMVQRIFESVSGIALSREDVLHEVDEVREAPTTVARYLARVVGYLNDYGKEQVLRAAALVSRCDGFVHYRESDMVRRLAAVMRMEPVRVDAILAELG